MAFHLSPAVEADIPDIVDVALAAFHRDPILSIAKQGTTLSELHDRDIKTYQNAFAEHDPHQHFTKITDAETGKLVSFCRWRSPAPKATSSPSAMKKPDEVIVKGLNTELLNRLRENLIASRKTHFNSSEDYFLHVLVTDPTYQRRGFGTRLAQHVMEHADRDNAKTYLDASSAGYPFYMKRGWKEIGQFEIGLDEFGGSGTQVVKCMSRPPTAAAVTGRKSGAAY